MMDASEDRTEIIAICRVFVGAIRLIVFISPANYETGVLRQTEKAQELRHVCRPLY